MPDPRNTDNAWLEALVVNFHDNGTIFQNYDLEVYHV